MQQGTLRLESGGTSTGDFTVADGEALYVATTYQFLEGEVYVDHVGTLCGANISMPSHLRRDIELPDHALQLLNKNFSSFTECVCILSALRTAFDLGVSASSWQLMNK
jgi:hypothetical protein